MAKVGRAARVASRQRVETLSGAKTIASAETGELYLVGAASTVTLPSPQDGAYFKFIFSADVTNASALLIKSHAAGSGDCGGAVKISVIASTGAVTDMAAAAQCIPGAGFDKLTIGHSGKKVQCGSFVECYCDGTNWFITGHIIAEHANVTAVFGSQ